ncbi:MAG: O-acetylhomoserine aminocarboxypropyltransferase/cysteine synthase family protein [Fidelibacterota bacterium]
MDEEMCDYGFDTIAIHGGYSFRESLRYETSVVPIIQSAVYPFESSEYAAKLFKYEVEGFIYGRIDNPTNAVFEKRIAGLEGGEAGLATSSGMAAIFMVAHHLVQVGDEIVSSNRVYGGTFELFDVSMKKMGVKVNWVGEPEKMESWERAITPRTKFLHLESPSNPNLFVGDIPALAELAHSHNIPLVVDNTICTPALQRPLSLGADVVVHSATKYLCGNATSISGVIVGKEEFINRIRAEGYRNMGPSLSPFNAWLNLLGMETLSLRMERHSSNALKVAKFLEGHKKVSSVHYPGLETDPYHEVARRQMTAFSSLLCFETRGTEQDAMKFIDNLKLITHTTHLGSSKTIATHPASTTHEQLGREERYKAGIGDTMIRMSVGLEDPDDLCRDLDNALNSL